jgi:hypothetical protein
MFGPKEDEVKGSWRKIRYEQLHNLYSYCYDDIGDNEMGMFHACEKWAVNRN